MMMRFLCWALAFTTVVAMGCEGGGEGQTRLIVEMVYPAGWGLTALAVEVDGQEVATVDAVSTLDLWVGEERASQPIGVLVAGLRGAERYASGAATATPVAGEAVMVAIQLTRVPCGAWCEQGVTRCEGDAVSVCADINDDGCLEWSAPAPCGANAPYCSLGTCQTECQDECDEGMVRCDGPSSVQTCGNYDSDDCLEWSVQTACAGETSCVGGQCVPGCADDCPAEGAQVCVGDQLRTCGDLNGDACLEWGPAVSCGDGQSCSGDSCAPVSTCTDDCSEDACEGLTYRTCGNYDTDSCLDLSQGTWCVPADPCYVGRCTLDGCDSAPLVCNNAPEPVCVDADTLRTCSDDDGVCNNGTCIYSCADTICPGGCTAGACNDVQGAVVVVMSGAGSGTVTSTPAGIACPGDCDEQYAAGTPVTLTAEAVADSEFAGWSGGACSGTGICTVTTGSQTVTVTASFRKQQQALTVTKTGSGSGSGTVTSSPSGINCGSSCNALFDQGTAVTLTAAPAAGSVFAGWSGAACTGTGTCTIVMNAEKAVAAEFTCASGEQTFEATGDVQTFTVPACVTSLRIEAWGASGGNGVHAIHNGGGYGGYAAGTLTVTSSEVLTIVVGRRGSSSYSSTPPLPSFGGGGAGGQGPDSTGERAGASGGGASDVRQGGDTLADRVLVAAGGGGGGGGCPNVSYTCTSEGGDGGGLEGDDGQCGFSCNPGTGGTQTTGGRSGGPDNYSTIPGSDGALGVGGTGDGSTSIFSTSPPGGGGGGGYYGGGGGSAGNESGGGGGSSYIGGVSDSTTESGTNSGDGRVVISW